MTDETSPSYNLTLEDVVRSTQEFLLEHGNHPPTVIAEGDQQTVVTQLEGLASTCDGRAQQLFMVGFALARSGEIGVLQQVFFIFEAWSSVAEPGVPMKHLPSQDPKRTEVVMIARQTFRPPRAEV